MTTKGGGLKESIGQNGIAELTEIQKQCLEKAGLEKLAVQLEKIR